MLRVIFSSTSARQYMSACYERPKTKKYSICFIFYFLCYFFQVAYAIIAFAVCSSRESLITISGAGLTTL